MKIVFIEAGMGGARSMDAMEPLAFAVLSGLTPKDNELSFYDDSIESVPDTLDADWVIISANTFTIKRAYALSKKYREQGIKVALGGFHPTLLPEEAVEYCDTVFVGDAEGTWSKFLEDASRNMEKRIYEQDNYPCIKNSYYDEGIFTDKKYSVIAPLQYSRGCKFDCDFCSISAVYKKSLRYREVELVVDEIKRRGLKHVFIVDDNLFSSRQKTKELLMAIKPLDIKWSCQISIDITRDDELLELMRDSGCVCVLIGFETINQDNLLEMNKASNIEHIVYEEAIKKLRCYGFMIYGTFILGYDNDGLDAFDKTLEFALDNQLFLANFNPLIPTAGTPLYDRLKSENRLLYDKWWLEEGYKYGDTVFRPKNMTPEQLKEGCFRIRKKFNSYFNIGRRFINSRQHFSRPILFTGANLITRREILRKQGREL